MADRRLPAWVTGLATEDLAFIRSFVLASGSLKALAEEYGVSYPTIRARLDRLIERLKAGDDRKLDPFHVRLKQSVAAGEVGASLARELLELHRQSKGGDDA